MKKHSFTFKPASEVMLQSFPIAEAVQQDINLKNGALSSSSDSCLDDATGSSFVAENSESTEPRRGSVMARVAGHIARAAPKAWRPGRQDLGDSQQAEQTEAKKRDQPPQPNRQECI